ncbi:FkbM family methyltransferase [Patescibacteria group bacterium]|nr:FkbM family methyltransferase [Patescibacteria group bacterium]
MTFKNKIKYRIGLLRNIIKGSINNNFRIFFLIQFFPARFSLTRRINQKYLKKCAKSLICSENGEEKIFDLKLFKVVAKEDNYGTLVCEFLDLIYPYLIKNFSIIREGPYEKEEVKLKQGDVVIDAGANLGIFSLFASKKVGPGGKVYAFEPILENRELLRKTIELNKINNIEIIPYALGKKEEDLLMSIEMDKLGSSSGFFQKGSERSVKQISLDKFVEQRQISKIDFIKADIEGMEHELLIGAEQTIKKFKPKLSICTYHKLGDLENLSKDIKSIEPRYVINHTEMKLYAQLDEMKIIGISLIKNEDLYIERVLKNVINFCDEIIVLDNMSEDNTFKIVSNLSLEYPKIKLSKIKDALASHKFIEKYANTNTWIFGVDGDEVYDPVGLERLRKEILAGKYQNYWFIRGNSLNAENINCESKIAEGYLSPPSRSMTKLFNFSILDSWRENCQRLHGTNLIFKKGFDGTITYKIFDMYDWDNSYFRMLHLCFINRTGLDKKYKNTARLSPEENSRLFPSFRNFISNLSKGRLTLDSEYKLRKYKKGKLITKNIQSFL